MNPQLTMGVRGSKDHLAALDGLRGLAILQVLWAHLAVLHSVAALALIDHVVHQGYVGVDIFFALSGFLITRILLVDNERGVPLRYFLARRALRIFPIYYLTLGAVLLAGQRSEIPWCVVYLSNFYFAQKAHDFGPLRHTWSLAVEEHFYLVWPLMVSFLPRRFSFRLAALCPVAAVVGAIALTLFRPLPGVIYMWTPFRVGSLATGALLAFRESSLRSDSRTSEQLWIIGLILGVAIVASELALPPRLYPIWYPAINVAGFMLIAGSLTLMAIRLNGSGSSMERWLTAPTLRYIGRISYGLYLYHFAVFWYLGVLEGNAGWLVSIGGLVLVFAIATTSFHFVERPILRFQNRFRARR